MSFKYKRLSSDFFRRDTVLVARELLGKNIVRAFDDGTICRYEIIETEAYCGQLDLACHASKGITKRTKVMFDGGGLVYVYLIYGQYWLLNFVTEGEASGSAVLVRAAKGFDGPGRLGRELQLDRSFYGENLESSKRIWLENTGIESPMSELPRIGIDYAGEPWVSKLWRFKKL